MEEKENTVEETEEKKDPSKEPEKEVKKVVISPEMLLTSLTTCKYVHTHKEAKEYALESISRFEKIIFVVINLLAVLLLLLYCSAQFKWSSTGLASDEFIYTNAVLACLGVALDLALVFITLYKWIVRRTLSKKKCAQKEEIYFLKSLIVHDTIKVHDKAIKKEEKIYNYSDIKKIIETKSFIIVTFLNNETLDIHKAEVNVKKIEIDVLRQKLEEESKKRIYVANYIKNPRYEVAFSKDLSYSRMIDLTKTLGILALISLLPPFFLNFRDGITLDCIFLFWIFMAMSFAFCIGLFVVKYNFKTPKKTFLFAFISCICVFVIDLSSGISSSVYNYYNRFRVKGEEFTALTGVEIPNDSILNESKTSTKREIIYGAYRFSTSGYLTNDEEVSSFETTLTAEGTKWKEYAKMSNLDINYMPSKYTYGDYFILYSETKGFFPYSSSSSNLRGVSDDGMWYVSYRKSYVDTSDNSTVSPCITIIQYNIITGYIWPLLPKGEQPRR